MNAFFAAPARGFMGGPAVVLGICGAHDEQRPHAIEAPKCPPVCRHECGPARVHEILPSSAAINCFGAS
jgi:hypothetical protein